ncbi:MAG: hypothetical protein RIA65_15630 [Woeseia sp.]
MALRIQVTWAIVFADGICNVIRCSSRVLAGGCRAFSVVLCAAVPASASASNFGDLPSVLPVFGVGLCVSLVVAIIKARVPATDQSAARFSIGRLLGVFALGAFVSFLILIALFMTTFN